jgi:hypothetical protein
MYFIKEFEGYKIIKNLLAKKEEERVSNLN